MHIRVKVLVSAIALTLLSACATRPQAPIEVNIVGFNDFHGFLEPSKFTYTDNGKQVSMQAGGIDAVAAHVAAWRKEDPSLIVAGAGDLVSASPAISAFWADEPTVNALNMLGLDVSSVGNHEFDLGRAELLRHQYGGCASTVRPEKTCKLAPEFKGARWTYLASNVIDKATGKPVLPAYRIIESKGVKIGFVGAVVKETPALVLASGIEGLEFGDEATAINRAIPELKKLGATVFVVLIHEGGATVEPFDKPDCTQLKGPITDIARALDPAVRLIITGHTHKGYLCRVDDRDITQAETAGHVLSRIKLSIDPATKGLLDVSARNVIVKPGAYPSVPEVAAYVKQVKARSQEQLARPVAKLGARAIVRPINAAGEAPLGQVIADAVLAATQAYGAQVGMMNTGGMRKDLDVGPDLVANYGHTQAVLPFGNTLVIMDMSGKQIYQMLEQQWLRDPVDDERGMLQFSQGFTFTWDDKLPRGARVVPGSAKLHGVAIEADKVYKVVANNFLAEGGDNFPVLATVKRKLDTQVKDIDAFTAYLAAQERAGKPVAPPAQPRVQRLN
jgi:5'-nucleotidase